MPQTYSTSDGHETLVWRVPRLWELARDLTVTLVDVNTLAAELDSVCWFDGEDPPTVRAVVAHARRIQEADFTHPILLSAAGHVMDGMHRLARALMLGMEQIAVVRFEVDPQPDDRIAIEQGGAFAAEESRTAPNNKLP